MRIRVSGEIIMTSKKKNLIYFILLGIFIVVFLFISILYLIKRNNSSIIIQGDPKNIVLKDFEGNLDFVAVTVSAEGGFITNENAISFSLDERTYSAQPHDLVIEFKNVVSDNGQNISGSISSPQMHFTPTDSELTSVFADKITIKKGDRLTEGYTDEARSSQKTVINNTEIYMSGFSSSDYLHIWNEYPLFADSNTVIKLSGEVISENGGQLDLKDFCSFTIGDSENLQMTLSDSNDDFYLNGAVKQVYGTLENDNAELYYTSSSSQNSFFCGNQNLYTAGKELKTTYIYGRDSADLVVNGKPSVARLEGIDVTEGFLQYLISNFDSFFMAFFGALLALVIDKTLKD